jgi:hypothetical protein
MIITLFYSVWSKCLASLIAILFEFTVYHTRTVHFRGTDFEVHIVTFSMDQLDHLDQSSYIGSPAIVSITLLLPQEAPFPLPLELYLPV